MNLINKMSANVVLGNGTSKSEKILSSAVTFIVAGSSLICDAAVARCGLSPAQPTMYAIQAYLKRTIVATVLPLTAAVTSRYADQLWLATPILPFVVNLTQVMDELNKVSDDAEMSHQALQKVEDFEVSVCIVCGWKTRERNLKWYKTIYCHPSFQTPTLPAFRNFYSRLRYRMRPSVPSPPTVPSKSLASLTPPRSLTTSQ
jgi:hypothetical protein